MTVIGDAFLAIKPESSKFASDTEKQAQDAGAKGAKGYADNFKKTLAGLGLALVIRNALGEADEAARGLAQTNAVLRSTGNAANVTAEQVDNLSNKLARQAAIDDDVIRQGANLLLTFTKVRNEVDDGTGTFDRATGVLVDMAAAMGREPAAAANTLGRALQDPVAALQRLTRQGVSFTEQQKDQVRAMVEAGDVSAAQGVILDALEVKYGGSAEAQATALGRIRVATGELSESLGGALMPALEIVEPALSRLVEVVDALPGPMQAVAVAGIGIGASVGPIGRSIEGFRSIRTAVSGAGAAATGALGAGSALAAGGPILLGVGAAAGIAALAVNAFGDDSEETAKKTATWVDALREANGELNDLGPNLLRSALGDSKQLDDIARAGVSVQDVFRGVTGSAADFRELRNRLEEAGEANSGLVNHLIDQRDAFRLATAEQLDYAIASGATVDEILNLGRASGLTEGELRTLGAALRSGSADAELLGNLDLKGVLEGLPSLMDDTATATTGVGDAAAGATPVLDEFGDEAEETGEQAMTAADRIDSMRTKVGEFFDEATRRIDAARAFRDSLAEIATTGARVGEEGLTGQNRIDAFTESISGAVGDVAALTDELVRQGRSTDEISLITQDYVNQLFRTADQAGLTAAEVEFLRVQYGLMPEQIDTEIRSNAEQVGLELDRLMQRWRDLGRLADINMAVAAIPGQSNARAAGGYVTGQGWYMAGEMGRELLALSGSGHMLTAAQTGQLATRGDLAVLARALRAAVNVEHLHITSTDPVGAAREGVDRLRLLGQGSSR